MGVFSNGRCRSSARLEGKVAIITGCNTGIGKETAKDFYKRGAKVIMACRDILEAQEAADDIVRSVQQTDRVGSLVVKPLDLSSFASVRHFAKNMLETESVIHLLINNAGVICPRSTTVDGYEMQFGVNHLGHFLLTCLLLPKLRSSAPARIVNVSSLMHKKGRINFDDLQSEKNYSPGRAYSQSKLANILFTKELALRLKDTGVTTYALHPGLVSTEMNRNLTPFQKWIYNNILYWFSKSPEDGAQTTIYCAVDEKLSHESGKYYSDCQRATTSRFARDRTAAAKLWSISTELTGLGSWDPCTAVDVGLPSPLL